MQRKSLLTALVLSVVGASAALADVLVETDREKVERLAELTDGPITQETMDEALSFVDVSRQPLTVQLGPQRRTFGAGSGADLALQMRDELRPLVGQELNKVQQNLELEGDSARLALRVRLGSELVDVVLELRRHADDWLISSARLR